MSDDFLKHPDRKNHTDPSTWNSKKNRTGGHQHGLKLVTAIAAEAMTQAGPLPSREKLREVSIRGLLAVAESEDVDVRARVVAYKAVLDHTDKMADREEDYSRLTNEELRQKVLEHARKLIAEEQRVPLLGPAENDG